MHDNNQQTIFKMQQIKIYNPKQLIKKYFSIPFTNIYFHTDNGSFRS